MHRLQVVHTHNHVAVATVTGQSEALVKVMAEAGRQAADQALGSIAHHVGLVSTETVGAAYGVGDASMARHTGAHARGICRKCHGTYPINKDGRIAKHGGEYGKRKALKQHCKGSGFLPLTLAGK